MLGQRRGQSFFASLKLELIAASRGPPENRSARGRWYIEVFFNRKRLHSSLDYLTP